MKAIEFYCGIGGMHYALKGVGVDIDVIAAFDINTTTNYIYRHNFPNTNLCQNNIQSVSTNDLEEWAADIWTLSPPCQPFTLKGNRLGEHDSRSDSLKMLMNHLIELKRRPRFVFLENVHGFEDSSMHVQVVQVLTSCGYSLEEFLLSPVQFGVPNSRPRYYLLAKLVDDCAPSSSYESRVLQEMEGVDTRSGTVSEYLSDTEDTDLLLTEDVLTRFGGHLHVVCGESTSSACFTKSYGSYMIGCGSYLREGATIRRFSPREVANLMCFPSEFGWPEDVSAKQLYRALGNSVNVAVIKHLLIRLITS